MSAQHTPGPVHIYKCTCGDPICSQYTLSTQGGVGFSLGDARLYAAAPDLLTEAKTLLATCELLTFARKTAATRALPEHMAALRAAIAKAESRP